MFAWNKLLPVVLSVVLLSAAVWVGYAVAGAPVDANAPITMTKGMYADLLCIAASEFDPYRGGWQFSYDPVSDTVRITLLPPSHLQPGVNQVTAEQTRKAIGKERVDFKLNLLLPKLQNHVSPAVSTAFVGF